MVSTFPPPSPIPLAALVHAPSPQMPQEHFSERLGVLVLCLLVNALGDLLPTSVESVSTLGLKDV